MKRQIKPNQFSIFQSELHRIKFVTAIKVNVNTKTVESILIENCITIPYLE